MKRIFGVLCLLSVAFAQSDIIQQTAAKWLEIFTIHKTECLAESGAMESDIINSFASLQLPDDNYNLKCYFKCVYRKLDFIDPDGTFHIPNLKTIPDTFEEMIVDCAREVANESDLCLKVYLSLKCGIPRALAAL
ncbi:hypothetical protein FQA39_LY18342 [Lamprigera yunnana]|nr:hypothetical protein FQA39_LY18342 [Lamprigera yunnana]